MESKNVDKIECKYMTKDNFTACGMIIDAKFPVPIIDHRKVKYVSFAVINATEVKHNYTVEPRIAYIADSANHCIRLLSVASAYVSTVAGVCGEPGLVDGLYSVNKLNRPEMIGVDAEGNLFIYDAGNQLIRLMDTTGFMHTMIDGACRLDRNMPTPKIPFDLILRGTVCYKNWKRPVIEEEH